MGDVSEQEIALGNEIRSWRNYRGLTMAELAHLTGVGRATIERIENGHTTTNMAKLWRIADALRVPLSVMIDRAEQVALMAETKKPWADENVLALVTDDMSMEEARRITGLSYTRLRRHLALSNESEVFALEDEAARHEDTEKPRLGDD